MLVIKTEVGPSPIHGLGCFAAQPLTRGQVVWEFHPQIDRRLALAEIAGLPLAVRDHLQTYAWVNPADGLVLFSGDHSKFFNHCDAPNTTMSPDGYCCRATRDIAAGEELTSNYAELWDVPPAGKPEIRKQPAG